MGLLPVQQASSRHGRAAGSGEVRSLLLALDIAVLFTNEEEAAALGEVRDLAGTVVVKHGAQGAEILGDPLGILAPAASIVPVDTTGAGDAFAAGFLAGWQRGRSPRACLADGNDWGGRCASTPGTVVR